jgi:hypothetical protein
LVALLSIPALAEENPSGAPSVEAVADGPRFRFGASWSPFGLQFISGTQEFISGGVYGQAAVDLRFGIQLRDWIGVYVQPHLAIGGGFFGASDPGGVAAATFMVDFTILSRLFLGVGGGIGTELGVANKLFDFPTGSCLQVRVWLSLDA